jgi:hypothetical protein
MDEAPFPYANQKNQPNSPGRNGLVFKLILVKGACSVIRAKLPTANCQLQTEITSYFITNPVWEYDSF